MSPPTLYRGMWPQNVAKLAKYAVRFLDGEWKVTVLYEAGQGLKYLAVEGNANVIARLVTDVKQALGDGTGGPFYVNEYRHVIVPVAAEPGLGTTSVYYCVGRLETDLEFRYEDRPLTTKPVTPEGRALSPGEKWVGPRPGIPYVLAAGAGDIYYKRPALTDDSPPAVRKNMQQEFDLSAILQSKHSLARAIKPIADIKGHQGGRFYVNEHGAIFTPMSAGDGNGLDYIYCGQIDRTAWFPEPAID